MSYMLEFPPRQLPDNVNIPPFVLFGICGQDCHAELPNNIPLNLVLHFIPELKPWVLPAPTNTPKVVTNVQLTTPHVGIDIQNKAVNIAGLLPIIKRIMQLSGKMQPKEMFDTAPLSLLHSVSIHVTWLALKLPKPGIDALGFNIMANLMNGQPIQFDDFEFIWEHFDHSSGIMREAGLNFMRNHAEVGYPFKEFIKFEAFGKGNPKTEEQAAFFEWLKNICPAYVDKLNLAAKQRKAEADVEMGEEVRGTLSEIMTKTDTRKVSKEERKEKEKEDRRAMRERLSRVPSTSSLRSIE